MTVYPNNIDTDVELPAVDDDITETGGAAIDALRASMFAVQATLGINPHGSAGSVADFLDVSFNGDGTIKGTALTSLGLLTNIIDSQIAAGAGIQETKLALAYNTTSLKNMIDFLDATIDAVNNYVNNTLTVDILLHLAGSSVLNLGVNGRHVASHVDLNDGYAGTMPYAYGIDARDPYNYFNPGLITKDGGFRTAKAVMQALIQVNDALVAHELLAIDAHNASAISVITSGFITIPSTAIDVQAALDFIDVMATTIYEEHRNTMHSNGITNIASSEDLLLDGYVQLIQSAIACQTTLTTAINDLVEFTPASLSVFELDRLFRIITVGDYINIDYGNITTQYVINSIRFEPLSKWVIKIDGVNLVAKTIANPAYASFEKKRFDDNIHGALAVCEANHNLWTTYPSVPGSLIVVDPRCAQATGLDVNLDELDSTHYNLHLAFYPDGTVTNIIVLPAIDVTGNAGLTPGYYTLQGVLLNVNNAFRSAGFNYRMVAFERNGQFGLSIADIYNNPGFSIISGQIDGTGSLTAGLYLNNVIGDDRQSGGDYKDALGLGTNKANVASPYYSAPTSVPGSVPTKVFVGRKNKNYNVNGRYQDYIAKDTTTNIDGYWPATITNRTITVSTVEVTYQVNLDLTTSKIKAGSTIVVQPTIARTDTSFLEQDYGRFIVKEVTNTGCPSSSCTITVLNGIYSTGNPIDISSGAGLEVELYFSNDSVVLDIFGVNDDVIPPSNTKRHYEIYASNIGETESFERARFDITSAAGLIDTDFGTSSGINNGWHIMQISPKLTGYVEIGGVSDIRRFVTFVIGNYNFTERSYDGFIMQTDAGFTTPFVGPVTRARKGEIGRYYDSNGVDYIDIMFNEDSNSDSAILSSTTDQRTMKIEIFPNVRLNNEFMCLGTCERLHLAYSGNVTGYITDLRQFGTVNEKVLSTSAIEFIEAGERYLHENGVVNDFDFINVDGNNNLFFNGGIGLVNGKMIAKNDMILQPTPVVLSGQASSTVDYALCLNEKGNVDFVLLAQVSALVNLKNNSTTTRYERTYNLNELVEKRKDLLPLWIITVTSQIVLDDISITTIATPVDIRRFITSGTINNLYVSGATRLDSDSDTRISRKFGHFDSLQAAVSYAEKMGKHGSVIYIQGTVYLDDKLTLPDNITLVGEKDNLVICRQRGEPSIELADGVTIRGINFLREYTSSVGTGAEAYSPNGFGLGTLVYSVVDGEGTYGDVTIEDCTFNTGTNRCSPVPHVLFEQVGDYGVFKNITIRGNKFLESLAQLDIAFVNRSGDDVTVSGDSPGTLLVNAKIENNVSNQLGYMMLSSDNNNNSAQSRGLSAYNVNISGNSIDYIWHNLSRFAFHGFTGTAEGMYNAELPAMHPALIISENTCTAITSRTIDGTTWGPVAVVFTRPVVATPSTIIKSNKCSHIDIMANADIYRGVSSGENYPGEVIISDNIVSSSKYDYTLFNPSDTPISTGSLSTGILVTTNAFRVNDINFNVNIHDNIINNPYDGLLNIDDYYYIRGIYTKVPAKISNNIIKKAIVTTGQGIYLDYYDYTTITELITASVNDNWIERGDRDINSYIQIVGTTAIKEIQIIDNMFDNIYVDNAQTDGFTIKYTAASAYKINAQRNLNQTFIVDMMPYASTNRLRSTIGWEKQTTKIYDAGPPSVYTFNNALVTDIFDGDFGNTDYNTFPFIVNLPYLDGAKPYYLNFFIYITNTASSFANQMTISAVSQSDIDSREYNLLTTSIAPYVYPATEYPVTIYDVAGVPATLTANNIRKISVDLTSLPSNYTTVISNSRTLPIYLFLGNISSGETQVLQKGSSSSYDQVKIYDMNGTFTY